MKKLLFLLYIIFVNHSLHSADKGGGGAAAAPVRSTNPPGGPAIEDEKEAGEYGVDKIINDLNQIKDDKDKFDLYYLFLIKRMLTNEIGEELLFDQRHGTVFKYHPGEAELKEAVQYFENASPQDTIQKLKIDVHSYVKRPYDKDWSEIDFGYFLPIYYFLKAKTKLEKNEQRKKIMTRLMNFVDEYKNQIFESYKKLKELDPMNKDFEKEKNNLLHLVEPFLEIVKSTSPDIISLNNVTKTINKLHKLPPSRR